MLISWTEYPTVPQRNLNEAFLWYPQANALGINQDILDQGLLGFSSVLLQRGLDPRDFNLHRQQNRILEKAANRQLTGHSTTWM